MRPGFFLDGFLAEASGVFVFVLVGCLGSVLTDSSERASDSVTLAGRVASPRFLISLMPSSRVIFPSVIPVIRAIVSEIASGYSSCMTYLCPSSNTHLCCTSALWTHWAFVGLIMKLWY